MSKFIDTTFQTVELLNNILNFEFSCVFVHHIIIKVSNLGARRERGWHHFGSRLGCFWVGTNQLTLTASRSCSDPVTLSHGVWPLNQFIRIINTFFDIEFNLDDSFLSGVVVIRFTNVVINLMLLCTLLHNNYSKFRRIIVITVAMIHMFIVLQWHYGSLATTVNYSWIYFKFSYKRFWWPFHFSASVGIVDSFRWCVCVKAMFSKCNDPKQQCVMLEEITKKSRLVYFRSTIILRFAYIMYVCARLPLPFIDVRFQQFLQNWKRYYLVHFAPARYFRISSWSCFNARAFLVVAIYKDN